MSPLLLALFWMAVASAAAILLFSRDKRAAKRHGRRTPERVLLCWMVVGGAPGALLAMALWRHKIRKPSFWIIAAVTLGQWAWVLWQLLPR